jgi:hypothetical protein
MIRLTISFIATLLIYSSAIAADTRVFFEGGETTSYTTHFLEDQFGSNTQSYWEEFIAEVFQSDSIYHSGSRSLYYNPYQTRNPYAQTGFGAATYGNEDVVDFTGYNNRYWYFRWYAYFGQESSLDGIGPKMYYLGCGNDYFYLAKTYDTTNGFIYVIRKDASGGDIISNGYPSIGGLDLYDQTWHKFEIFIDFGSSNAASDGDVWVQIDDSQLLAVSNLDFDTLPNPVGCIAWPSNCTACTGSQEIYYDDMEVWTLDASLGQGDTEPSASDTTPPEISGNPTIGSDGETITINFTETVVTTGYDNGDFDLDCSSAGNNIALNSISGSGSSRTFTSATTIYNGDTCNLDYTGGADEIEDAAGNDLAQFSDDAMTNNSTQGTSSVAGVSVNLP